MSHYTGVGSRSTPGPILTLMTEIACCIRLCHGTTLRSGGAVGADTAFEQGAGTMKRIYTANNATEQAMSIAQKFHPAWNRCSDYARKLHGRNSFQVLGDHLNSPSLYLICWTPDGCICHADRQYRTGGTGTAISIAFAYGVPVWNLQREDHYQLWVEFTNRAFAHLDKSL